MIKAIDIHCQGERNISSGQRCRDCSLSFSDDQLSLAVVCDADSPSAPPLSDKGARTAAEIAGEAIRDFVRTSDHKLFKGQPLTAKTGHQNPTERISQGEYQLRRLIRRITIRWEEEVEALRPSRPSADYACSLLAYAQTRDYWFAFQIGKGRLMTFHRKDAYDPTGQAWSTPLPAAPASSDYRPQTLAALEREGCLSLCLCGNSPLPMAVFLSNDGILQAYPHESQLANYYIELMKVTAKDGVITAIQQLRDDLPLLSRMGSQGDTTLATLFDVSELKTGVAHLILSQIRCFTEEAEEVKSQLATCMKQPVSGPNRREDDFDQRIDRLEVLNSKLRLLSKEYQRTTGRPIDDPADYSQEIETARTHAAARNEKAGLHQPIG